MNDAPKKVLIVEDDALLSMVGKRLVQKIGHEVVQVVDNGKDAIAAVRNHSPDVVLMDVRINGEWDGIDTAQELQKEFSVPIIYLSGSTYAKNYKRAEEIGFSGFLQKPVKIDELQDAFSKVFGNSRTHYPKNKISSVT